MLNTATLGNAFVLCARSIKCFSATNPVMFSIHSLAMLWNCLYSQVPPGGLRTIVSVSESFRLCWMTHSTLTVPCFETLKPFFDDINKIYLVGSDVGVRWSEVSHCIPFSALFFWKVFSVRSDKLMMLILHISEYISISPWFQHFNFWVWLTRENDVWQ